MKALVYHGTKDLRLEMVKEPVPGPDEVKLCVDYCCICATDIEEYLYGPLFISREAMPVITGHEVTGTVVDMGEGVRGIGLGNRVVLNGVLGCESCWLCRNKQMYLCPSVQFVGFGRDGGLAEYVVWPASNVVRLPDNVASEEAALAEPASVALHSVRKAGPVMGASVLVLGVGPVGMLAMQVARAMGARVYAADRRKMSLDLARDLGAEAAIDTDAEDADERIRELTDGRGMDVVIDAAGGPETPALAIRWTRSAGRVVLVAIYTSKTEFDFNLVVAPEVEIVGSLAYEQRDVEEVVGHIASGSVKTRPLISDVIGLDEVLDVAFPRMMAPTKDFFRILVSPSR